MSVMSALAFSLGTLLDQSSRLKVIHLILFIIICLGLSLLGDSIDYLVGKYMPKLMEKIPWFRQRISSEQLSKGYAWIQQHGQSALFISRYVPGMRTITSYVAGWASFSYFSFFICNILSNLLLLVGCSVIGYFLGTLPFVKKHYILIISTFIIVMTLPMLFLEYKKRKNSGS